MEEDKLNILKAKIKGYVVILKGLSNEVKKLYEPMKVHRDVVASDVKSDSSNYDNVKDNLKNLESLSIEMNMMNEDIKNYLFKVGTLNNVLTDFGGTLEFNDEESNQIIKLADIHSKDKEAFTYSILDGELIVMNEEVHKEMTGAIGNRISDEQAMRKLHEKAKELLSQVQ